MSRIVIFTIFLACSIGAWRIPPAPAPRPPAKAAAVAASLAIPIAPFVFRAPGAIYATVDDGFADVVDLRAMAWDAGLRVVLERWRAGTTIVLLAHPDHEVDAGRAAARLRRETGIDALRIEVAP